MALSTELENLVKELEKVDPEAAKEQRALLEKHAKLQEPMKGMVLRQQDYDRFLNQNKEKLSKYDQTLSDWDKNYKIHQQLLKDHEALQTKYSQLDADLQAKVAAESARAAAGGDGTVDPVKLADAVRERIKNEYVSKADVDRIVSEESKKQTDAARKEFFDKTFPETANWITSMLDAQLAYFQETGKRLDRAEFAKFLKENNIADPQAGLEKFMEPVRNEKKIADEVNKRVEEEKKKLNGNSDFPGSNGTPQPLGALQIRLSKREEGDPLIPKDAELGDGSLAMAAAKELRAGV